ncbi:MAG TPA: glycosyltransferase family 39 protein [Chthoniobacterales bacterium]|nr:glycosyltransferase family 39 protein [Chthoniobacterales bacterium]
MPLAIRNFALVFLGSLLLHVAGTWNIPLVDRDEPRFAEAAREMRERGDYVIPYFNDKYRFDKPPLIYWTQIVCYRAFGENEFAARLPSAVAAALTAVLLFAWGRRIGGERTGWWAAIIFTLCLQTFVHAKAAVADMWLVFFVTAASWAAFELLADSLETASPRAVGDDHRRNLKYWRLAFYLALGLGFLAKGPLAWLPLLTVLSTKLFVRGQSLTRRFWFVTGMLGALVIVCAWAIPALIRTNGEYFNVGIGRHVVERSFNVMEGHGANSWNTYLAAMPFYFLTVFISFFPWSIKLPALTKHLWRERDAIDKYLISGILIVFIIMSLVKTKLPHYTLPAFPLLSLLMARHLFHLRGSPRFAPRTAAIACAVSLGAAFILFPLIAPTFPSAQLYKMSRDDLRPEMDFANVDYAEPSVVWYFRSRAKGFFRGLSPDQVEKFMNFPGPRFVIIPTPLAQALSAKIPPTWKTYRAKGFTIVKGRPTDLTLILKQSD